MEHKYNLLERQLDNAGFPKLMDYEFFKLKNLRITLLEHLHKIGIPEENLAIRESNEIPDGALSTYKRGSQFSGQHSILINTLDHFNFIYNSGEESESRVKDTIIFSLLHAYGQSIYEYFNSDHFISLYKKNPLMVNQNCRIMKMFFPTKNIMGNIFANYVLDKGKNGHREEALLICLEQYKKLHFTYEAIEQSSLPRYDRIFRQHIDYLCGLIHPNTAPLKALENSHKVVREVAEFLMRNEYNVKIIRGEGFAGSIEDFPQEFKDKEMSPFLFTHEAVLCDNINVVDFCAITYCPDNPIMVGPKYKWKKFWNELSITKELPHENKKLKNFNFEFSDEHSH